MTEKNIVAKKYNTYIVSPIFRETDAAGRINSSQIDQMRGFRFVGKTI